MLIQLVALTIGTASAFTLSSTHAGSLPPIPVSTRLGRIAAVADGETEDSCLVDEPAVECAVRKQVDGPWADTWAKYVLLRPGMTFRELKEATLRRNQLDPR